MYPPNPNSKIIELSHIPPEPNDPFPLFNPINMDPIIFNYCPKVCLAYYTNRRILGDSTKDIALITFNAFNYRFGWPNEEILSAHPLHPNGLRILSIVEVKDSPWIQQLDQLNSSHSQHTPADPDRFHHYIFAFHDCMFECISRGYSVKMYNGRLEDMVPIMRRIAFPRENKLSRFFHFFNRI
jgi:hypothetical protein